MGAAAGSGTTGLTISPAGSAWTTSSNAPWLTFSPPSGNGSAILDYSYTSNLATADPRTATITATNAGATANFVVNQAGAPLSLSSTSASVSGSAGSGTFIVTTGAGVTWTATSNAAWLTVTPSGTGSGTVTYNYADTTLLYPRTGQITVGGQTFTVTQAGATISFEPSVLTVPAGAGSVQVTLRVTPNTASWNVGQNNGNWDQINPKSGTGTTELAFSFQANPTGMRRSDRLWAGSVGPGVAFTAVYMDVTQEGRETTLSSYSALVPATAGSGSFSMTVDPPDAPWSVTVVQHPDSNNENWLSITPTSGIGNASIQYSYAINLNERARIGTIVIGGRRFGVSQRGSGGSYSPWGSTTYSQVVALPVGKKFISVDGAGNLYDTQGSVARWFDVTLSASASINLDISIGGTAVNVTGTGLYVSHPLQCYVGVWNPTNPSYNYMDLAGMGGGCTFPNLSDPRAIALDDASNLFIVDAGNVRVRRLEGRSLSTVAGNGNVGNSMDGAAATASAIDPRGIAVDSAGNVYFSEPGRVRKVDVSTGILSTVAGQSANAGFSGDGGLATQALLNDPKNIAIDNADNLYILDAGNYRIRKVDAATQIISTIIGNGTPGNTGDGGPAHLATITAPDTVAVDNVGNVYFSDANVTPSARFINLAVPRPPLTITADNAGREYGLANPAFTGTIGTPQAGDTVSAAYTTSATAASGVGTYDIIPVAQGADAWKYEVTPVKGTLTVTPAPLTVTANSFTRAFGAPNPVLTGTLGPTRNGDVIGVTYSTSATQTSLPGTYPIVPALSGSQLPNYAVTATNGTLTISDVVLTLDRPRRPARSGSGAAQTFDFQVAGAAAGEPVAITCAASAPYVCSAPRATLAGPAGAGFQVAVRHQRSRRLQRPVPGTLLVSVTVGGLRRELAVAF